MFPTRAWSYGSRSAANLKGENGTARVHHGVEVPRVANGVTVLYSLSLRSVPSPHARKAVSEREISARRREEESLGEKTLRGRSVLRHDGRGPARVLRAGGPRRYSQRGGRPFFRAPPRLRLRLDVRAF